MGELKYVTKITNRVIAYTFTLGVVLALILGIVSALIPENIVPFLTSALILAGLIIGFFKITKEEAKDYIVFGTALVIITSLTKEPLSTLQWVGIYLNNILSHIMIFVVPSVIVVTLRSVLRLAEE